MADKTSYENLLSNDFALITGINAIIDQKGYPTININLGNETISIKEYPDDFIILLPSLPNHIKLKIIDERKDSPHKESYDGTVSQYRLVLPGGI